MSKLIDLTNQKFGRLTVLERDKNRKTTGGSYWICQCECGTIKSVKSISLRNGDISSCGCYRQEQLKKAKRILIVCGSSVERVTPSHSQVSLIVTTGEPAVYEYSKVCMLPSE